MLFNGSGDVTNMYIDYCAYLYLMEGCRGLYMSRMVGEVSIWH